MSGQQQTDGQAEYYLCANVNRRLIVISMLWLDRIVLIMQSSLHRSTIAPSTCLSIRSAAANNKSLAHDTYGWIQGGLTATQCENAIEFSALTFISLTRVGFLIAVVKVIIERTESKSISRRSNEPITHRLPSLGLTDA